MSTSRKNRIVLITGDGKGKTTAAWGMVLRASGHRQRVCVIQFVKGRKDTGETRGLAQLAGVETHVCGEGFVFPGDGPPAETHRRAAADGLRLAEAKLRDPSYGMVVLDEVCGAVAVGVLSAGEVLEVLRAAASGTVIVLTGRDACRELIEVADTVSRVECVKHGLEAGWPAQRGVEL